MSERVNNCFDCENVGRCRVDESELDTAHSTRPITTKEVMAAAKELCPDCDCVKEIKKPLIGGGKLRIEHDSDNRRYYMQTMQMGKIACGKHRYYPADECPNFSKKEPIDFSMFGGDLDLEH